MGVVLGRGVGVFATSKAVKNLVQGVKLVSSLHTKAIEILLYEGYYITAIVDTLPTPIPLAAIIIWILYVDTVEDLPSSAHKDEGGLCNTLASVILVAEIAGYINNRNKRLDLLIV